ncbi:hypothetical protein Y032_0371g135 [Ancylostoma ceylanicum]|uniref:Uncharacterized protein n=1 Tax=Ancylostoma ceylanicum TaxID=53326 RepID=A0A016RUB3_9BILA|nr:hypothetical protein Y032_0371g135 [Ancylostoma ceylanicum]
MELTREEYLVSGPPFTEWCILPYAAFNADFKSCENESLFLLTGTRRCETFRIIINTGQTLEFVERRSLNGRNHNRDIHHTKNGHNSSQRAVV